jgi:hypothetical protein
MWGTIIGFITYYRSVVFSRYSGFLHQ